MRYRDNQRKRVYDWERAQFLEFHGWAAPGVKVVPMTLRECVRLAKRAFVHYGVRAPGIRDGRGCRSARGGRYSLTLPVWARTPRIVLHECAHGIQEAFHRSIWWKAREGRGPRDWSAHGAVFARIFLDLLARYAGDDRTATRQAMRARRIRVAAAGEFKPIRLREVLRPRRAAQPKPAVVVVESEGKE